MTQNEHQALRLLEDHAGIIHKLCFMYTNNSEEYKDLKQEISYQIIKSANNFKGESKLSTWVYKVSLFTALSFIKRKPKNHEQIETVAEDITAESEFDEWNTVLEKIKTLPEMDKTLIFLYLEDKPYKEIAEIMGISETNVGVRLNRVKKKMKDYFTEQ